MIWITILGLVMAGTSILFTIIEALPFIAACKNQSSWAKDIVSNNPFWFTQAKIQWLVIPKGATINLMAYTYLVVFYTINMLKHIPKLLPSIIDFAALWALAHFITLGQGYAAGITAYFISNVISVFIYYHTHIKSGVSWKGVPA